MKTIKINVGRQASGYTFRLHPESRKQLSHSDLEEHPASSLFVGFDEKQHFDQLHGSMGRHIAAVLTGLSEQRITELGGVTFVDPVTEREMSRVLS